MKKFISISLILFAGICSSFASPVSRSAAQDIAKSFFATQDVVCVWSGETTKATVTEPSYYVFNNPSGGWVIIAGDDCCEPVLAYNNSGSFKSSCLPSNFRVWMESVSRNVNLVRKAGLSPQKEIKARWESTGSRIRKSAKTATQSLIETASWGQDAPYNNSCPEDGSERSCTGCVATAMAIVLRHHQHPEKGTGTIPSYTTYSQKLSVLQITLGQKYDWDNMPYTYGSSATDAQKTAVATLMYHCGAMVQMDYASSGSGALSADIIPALVKYMGYSPAARELFRYNYSNTDWFNIIKNEIDAGRPLIYGGGDSSTGDGHQFVLDGYNSDNYVHINWGWTGSCNAWYAINYLGDKSSSGVNDVFSYGDGAIIGLIPDNGKASTESVELCLEADTENNLYGISLASGSIAKGSSFSINIGLVCNYNYSNSYSGAIKVGLYDKNGTFKEYVCGEQSVTLNAATVDSDEYINPSSTYINNLSCSISKDIALGDYLMAVYKNTDGDWVTLGGYSSDEFTDSDYEYYTNYKLGCMDLAYINIPSTLSAGQILYFDLIRAHRLPESVVWYWNNTANTKRYVVLTSGTHSLKVIVTYTDGTKETIHRTVKVN